VTDSMIMHRVFKQLAAPLAVSLRSTSAKIPTMKLLAVTSVSKDLPAAAAVIVGLVIREWSSPLLIAHMWSFSIVLVGTMRIGT